LKNYISIYNILFIIIIMKCFIKGCYETGIYEPKLCINHSNQYKCIYCNNIGIYKVKVCLKHKKEINCNKIGCPNIGLYYNNSKVCSLCK